MDINDLTIGQARELTSIFGSQQSPSLNESVGAVQEQMTLC